MGFINILLKLIGQGKQKTLQKCSEKENGDGEGQTIPCKYLKYNLMLDRLGLAGSVFKNIDIN